MADIKQTPTSNSVIMKAESEPLDLDERRLAEMGYVQDLKRNYSVWSVLGVGFSLTNSWWGVSAAMITGINSGGPVLLIYGIILMALIGMCVGISLSELASAYPNAAGQHFWVKQLAPKRYSKIASYLTGWVVWSGSIFASASVALSVGAACVGCYQLAHPDFEIQAWHTFVAYQLVNAVSFIFNCYGKYLPYVSSSTLYTSLISFVVILIVVPAKAPTHEDAKFVFDTFLNNTGWSNDGIAFIVGLINANWGFSCLDSSVHMAEEIHRPERSIPIAIMGTVGIGFVTSWFFSISMMFSLNNFDAISSTYTGVPILELFYQALENKAGAIVLEALVIATGIGCQIACHTWQSRLCWSFARDHGLPWHKYLSHVNSKLDVPLRAHFVSCCIVAVLGCLYLGSYTAFNSMVIGCIVMPYISYAIPVIFLLIKGRGTIPHGPFWLGRFGFVCNFVLIGWTIFTIVMYSFPAVYPVEAGNMNYISAVYGIVIIIVAIDWFARGKREYESETHTIAV